MTFATLMVSVDLGAAAAERIQLAAGLAARVGARLTGVAACPVPIPMPASEALLLADDLYESEEERARERLDGAKALFEREAGAVAARSWHAGLGSPSAFLAERARGADLVLVGRQGPADGDPGPLGVSAGTVLMEAGRPVLVVPPGLERLDARRVVVAWKDTREARRAVRDALPFLAGAERVQVVAVGAETRRDGAEGTAAYLAAHGVAATAQLLPGQQLGAADPLLRFAAREEADLIVMGAYGHSRLREWAFGGATRDILRTTPICCLASH